MERIFGTPIHIYNADDPSNKTSKDGKGESVSGRIKDVLKALQPLEKAMAALENASKALDGTGYDDLKKGIDALTQQATAKIQETVKDLTGGQQQAQQQGQPVQGQPTQGVPTAGQIAGREPLPGQK